jgi:uncharacterized LabA/DUF88 family protein
MEKENDKTFEEPLERKIIKNMAFVDGQNLYLGTTKNDNPWIVDLVRFRIYLEKKYNVESAYYFLGWVNEKHENLYGKIQQAGFVLVFRQHNSAMAGKKKGNVDSDIIFQIMKKLYKQEVFDKILLVSGDGDYKMLVDFLIEENRFEKILFPNKKFASSLYKGIASKHYDYLEDENIKEKIRVKDVEINEKGSLGS